MDAAGELAQLLERVLELVAGAVEQLLGALGVVAAATICARRRSSASETSRCWAPSCRSRSRRRRSARPTRASGRADSRSSSTLRPQLGVEALLLERQRRRQRRPPRSARARRAAAGRGSAPRRARPSSDVGDRAVVARPRELHRPCARRRRRSAPSRAASRRAPARIVERPGERIAQLAGRRARRRAGDQLADRAAAQHPRPGEAGEEQVRDQPERDQRHVEERSADLVPRPSKRPMPAARRASPSAPRRRRTAA